MWKPRSWKELVMKNRTDAELVAIYSETGDENAFSEIMSRYGKMVHGVCRKYVQDIHEAEDLSQMVFMVLTEKAKSLKEGKALSPWLYGVAKNLSLQALARRVRRIRHAETLFLMESMREGQVEPIHDHGLAVADSQVRAGEDVGGVAHRSNRLKITAKIASKITMKVMPSTAAEVAASPTPRAERLATEPR
jgi:RNA polymerase sigma factor (sigma-70 family)